MRKSLRKRLAATIIAVWFSAIAILLNSGVFVYAENTTINIDGKQYELEPKSKYAYTEGIAPATITSSGSQFGQFSITGNLNSISAVDGFTSYEVLSGVATLSYNPSGKVIGAAETDWHLVEDKGTEINGEKIDNKILNGAVMLQTSIDGQNWITDLVKTNVAGAGTDYKSDFYSTPEIQLINGCYYRVIIVYEVARKLEDKQYWFVSVDNEEQKKYVEVYDFYLKDTSDALIANGDHPDTKKVVGDSTMVINTGKDNGFSGHNAITTKDPHYGWKIGEFSLNGFTNTADYQGEEYFIKNLNDVITLSFNLKQDINCLNGNDSLSVAEDNNGSDQYFQVPKTNFKHGTLIIQFTDYQGNKSEPIIYTDFLAANSRTGADTRVQVFEEGDYEVALDYEIKDKSGIDSYTDYRMSFTFKIRNGNSMVYAFDNKGQLADKAWTSTGFTINTANSHYLTTMVKKYAVVDGVGGKKLDMSWNRTASDGNSYNEEGVYIVTVSNRYQPNGDVSKTFYVGNDPYVRAIAITGKSLEEIVELTKYTEYDIKTYLEVIENENKSIDEIVNLVNQGWTIESGHLIEPILPEPENEIESSDDLASTENDSDITESEIGESEITESEITESEVIESEVTSSVSQNENDEETNGDSVDDKNVGDENKGINYVIPFALIIFVVIASAGGFYYMRIRNNKNVDDKSENKDGMKGGEI